MLRAELHVLMLEGSPADAELLERELQRGGIEFTATRVDTSPAFEHALMTEVPDIILANYSIPAISGMEALEIAREMAPEMPFIFVSGSIGEERAVEALRAGATDYILKDRLSQLPSAVERAIKEREERQKHRHIQETLRVCEERFQHAVRATREVIFDWDMGRDVVWANEAFKNEWGYNEEALEMPHARWEDLIHPDDLEGTRKSVAATLDEGRTLFSVQFRMRRADGSYGHVLERGVVIRDGSGRPVRVIGAMQDITDRVLADQKIRMLSMENEQILQYAAEGILGVHRDGSPTFVNPAALKILGRDATELFHLTSVHQLAQDRTGGKAHGPENCPLLASISDQKAHSGESQFRTKTDKVIDVEYTTSPILDEAGSVNGCVVTFQDITERKQLEHQLQTSERVSSLGRVAATMAHEFNNVLMGVQPFAEVIRRRGEGDEKVQRAAAQILQSVSRGRQITQEILRVANPGQTTPQSIDVAVWMRQVVDGLVPVVGAQVRLIVRIEDEPIYARCDPSQIQQVVTNLVLNARDAMPRGGSVTLSARAREMVELTIADTGEGISEDLLPKIFEPLFTTKRTGTGLGLAVARQLVVKNGGSIRVESTVGRGTLFSLCLPRTEKLDELVAEALPQRSVIRRILIIDDEPAITTGMTALLESEGFVVRTVDRGLKALAAVDAFDPEALILDLTLPDIDGTEVYRRVAARRPGIRVIFASGHMDEELLRDSVGKSRVAFLHKPYDFEMLMGALEEIS